MRRRVVAGTAIALALAGAVALVVHEHSAGSRSSAASPKPVFFPDTDSAACVIGTAHLCDWDGVRSVLQQSARTQGRCLVHHIDRDAPNLHVAPQIDAEKFCFSPRGALIDEWEHSDGRWLELPIFPRPVVPPLPSQL